jgi:hypothetical protein
MSDGGQKLGYVQCAWAWGQPGRISDTWVQIVHVLARVLTCV